jgi:hypothetical protein
MRWSSQRAPAPHPCADWRRFLPVAPNSAAAGRDQRRWPDRRIGHLGLDGINDDEVLLAGNEDDTDDPSVTPGGLLDVTDDGGVMKALLVPGWKSPSLGFGDEISISVLGREAKPNVVPVGMST